MDYINTITIPAYKHPNFLSVCLDGLIKNSRFNHKIIIVGSKQDIGCSDFMLDSETFKTYHLYENMRHFLSERKDFLIEHDITYIDCTEEIKEFTKKYRHGRIPTGKKIKYATRIEDGAFIAFKNNFALDFVKTKYVMNNWDADFYPAPDWDVGLMNYATEFENKQGRYMFIPNHVQPLYFDTIPLNYNAWEDFRHIKCEAMMFPSSKRGSNDSVFVTEEDWNNFVLKFKKAGIVTEKPGERKRCHWVPVLYKTDEFKEHLKGYSYQGVCYDLEIDNRSADVGFMKICPNNSFILHKGWIPYGDSSNDFRLK